MNYYEKILQSYILGVRQRLCFSVHLCVKTSAYFYLSHCLLIAVQWLCSQLRSTIREQRPVSSKCALVISHKTETVGRI